MLEIMTRLQLIQKILGEGSNNELIVDEDFKLQIGQLKNDGRHIKAIMTYQGEIFKFYLWGHYKTVDNFYGNINLLTADKIYHCVIKLRDYLGLPKG